ncbi:DUF1801 domain-containing protein [Actinophytocola oryzae]|uniref:Uncharacterized protein DUF1801 n=1 Tax=Actinophytocola oryzae TaxID=502181 RepID=A0A4R7W694_9PSEU|nr:DUF1801 domain-containing protein [Actinophytocola oryzae]TDV57805.1 uncharacterized protein DUF1801 [Actinophytocola oryzae]
MPTTVSDYVTTLPEPQRRIAEQLVRLVDAELPGTGVVWHGHPVWSLGSAPGRSPVCLIKARSTYVTFSLWRGQEVDDPSGRLTAGARAMAGVKLRSLDDVDADLFTGWLRQAAALDGGR